MTISCGSVSGLFDVQDNVCTPTRAGWGGLVGGFGRAHRHRTRSKYYTMETIENDPKIYILNVSCAPGLGVRVEHATTIVLVNSCGWCSMMQGRGWGNRHSATLAHLA